MKKKITDRLSFVLTEADMRRLQIEEGEMIRITADVHGMKVVQARKFINNIINLIRTAFEMVVIHGYNHGIAIKNMLANQFRNEHISLKYQDENNQGITHIVVEG